MKILHVVHGYTPAIGGTEYLIQKISENLVKMYQDEVTVYTTNAYNCELFWRRDQPQMPVGIEEINGVLVHRFPVFNYFNRLRYLAAGTTYKFGLPYNDWFRALQNGPLIPGMTKRIAEAPVDVIAGSSFPLLHMHYMQWAGKRSGKPVVYHGGIHTADPYGFERPMIYKAIKQVDGYVAYTSFERDYLLSKGIAKDKMQVTGLGIDPQPFEQANGRSLREKFGWSDSPVIAFVGQQVPHKGIDMLIEAMPHIWTKTPNACVLIAGAQTTYSTTIQQWYDGLTPEQQSQVAILNNFSNNEKPDIFAACDLLVFPSGHESFGFVILEAWAAKKPVIGARIGAVPTVIDEGENGLLIEHRSVDDLTRAIQHLLSHPAERHALGEAGRQKIAEQYTWEIVTAKFRAAYERVLASRV
ncbi:MAG: glycosyltransferase family 4 protein [Chloroflexota bacterium]